METSRSYADIWFSLSIITKLRHFMLEYNFLKAYARIT